MFNDGRSLLQLLYFTPLPWKSNDLQAESSALFWSFAFEGNLPRPRQCQMLFCKEAESGVGRLSDVADDVETIGENMLAIRRTTGALHGTALLCRETWPCSFAFEPFLV